MQAAFDAALIGQLKQRVIDHNEANPAAKTKLADLRKVYERNFKRTNPGARAMAKVDGYLSNLAKAEGEFEEDKHPRGHGGEFASKDGGPSLPATVGGHRELQANNASYRALTSDALPDNRHEAAGAIGRDAVSAAAGVAVVGALSRQKTTRALENLIRKPAGNAAGLVAGTAGHLVGSAAARAKAGAHRVIPSMVGPVRADTVGKIRRASRDAGRAVGGAVAARSVRAAAAVVQGALRTAGNGDMTEKAETHRAKVLARNLRRGVSAEKAGLRAARAALRVDGRIKFGRQAAVFGVLAGAAGLAIHNTWKDSWADPAAVGRTLDAYSYRLIEKAANSTELGAARVNFSNALAKGVGLAEAGGVEQWLASAGSVQELTKSIPWSKGIVRLITGIAGAGGTTIGGALGGVAAHLTAPIGGDPQFDDKHPRDEKGRFSTKAGRTHRFMQVGALLGGAAGALAAHRAFSTYNARISRQMVARQKVDHEQLVQAVKNYRVGPAATLHADEHGLVRNLLRTDSEHPQFATYRKQLQELEAMTPSSSAPIQNKIRQSFHRVIADELMQHDSLEVPTSKSSWTTLGEATQSASPRFRMQEKQDTVLSALNQVDDAGWKRMLDGLTKTKSISAAQRKSLERSRLDMKTAMAGVTRNLETHGARVAAAKDVSQKASKVAIEAKGALDLAVTNQKLQGPAADEATQLALKQAVDDATDAHTKAVKAMKLAERKHSSLADNPVGVVDPITKRPISPPSEAEIAAVKRAAISQLRAKYEPKAQRLVREEKEAARDHHLSQIHEDHVRDRAVLAGQLALAGSAPTNRARTVMRVVARVKDRADAAEKAFLEAQAVHSGNEQTMAQLTTAMKTTTKGGKTALVTPKGMKPAEAEALRGRADEITAAFAKSRAALDAADLAYEKARLDLGGAARRFSMTMQEAQQAERRPLLALSDEFKDEAARAHQELLKEPLEALFNTERGARLKAWAQKQYQKERATAGVMFDHAKQTGKKALEDVFMREDGKGGKRIDYGRVVQALGLSGAFVGAAREDLITHAQRIFASGDTRQKAKNRSLNINSDRVVLDPLSGRGYWVVTMPDPHSKDRIVLTGTHADDNRSPTATLTAGSSLESLKGALRDREERLKQKQQQRFQQQGGQGHTTGAMPKMSEDDRKTVADGIKVLRDKGALETVRTFDGGPTFQSRNTTFQPDMASNEGKEQNSKLSRADSAVIATLKDKHGLRDASPSTAEAYHDALAALFSDEARGLKTGQKFMYLAGFDGRGNAAQKNKPIFRANADFGGNREDALSALSDEIDHAMTHRAPKNGQQTANLQRAVGLVATVKGLAADDVKPIFDKIRSTTAATAPTATPAAASPTPPFKADRTVPVVVPSETRSVPIQDLLSIDPSEQLPEKHRQKPGWDATIAGHAAIREARDLYEPLGLVLEHEQDLLPAVISNAAKQLGRYGIKEDEAVTMIADGFKKLAAHPHEKDGFIDALSSFDPEDPASADGLWRQYIRPLVSLAVAKHKRDMAKAAHPLDSLEAMLKVSMGEFVDALHPRVAAGEAGGGEFTASSSGGHGGASPAQRIAGEAAEAGAIQARRAGKSSASDGSGGGTASEREAKPMSWAHPVRLGNELGGALGFDAALNVANAVIPEARAGVGVIRGGLKLLRGGAGLALGSAGAEGASEVGEALGAKAYRAATGRKAPGYSAPEPASIGSMVANGIGGIVGGSIGNRDGLALGRLAAPAIGRTVGGWAGRAIGDVAGSVAGPVGAVLGGAALGYAGSHLGQAIYDWAQGYDKPSVARAMNRFKAPAAS